MPKRTYQPKRIKRIRKFGFLARMADRGGRAVLARPQIVMFDGILHSMPPVLRETLLRRLCSKDEPWSVIFVSNDPNLTPHVDRRLILE